MKYERNKWIYQAIEEVDIEKLKAFQEQCNDTPLADVLDRGCRIRLAALSPEQLEKLEQHFHGIIAAIPLDIALAAGNIWLLEQNKERYFRGAWDQELANGLLFCDYQKAVPLKYFTDEKNQQKVCRTLSWVADHVGLPSPQGELDRFCSKIELTSPTIWGSSMTEDERDSLRVFAKKIRSLQPRRCLYVPVDYVVYCTRWTQEDFDPYDEIMICCCSHDMENSKNFPHEFLHILGECPEEKLTLDHSEELLHGSKLMKTLLKYCGNEDELQEKLCAVLEQSLGYQGIEALYQAVDDTNTGAFSVVMNRYFDMDQDTKFGEER